MRMMRWTWRWSYEKKRSQCPLSTARYILCGKRRSLWCSNPVLAFSQEKKTRIRRRTRGRQKATSHRRSMWIPALLLFPPFNSCILLWVVPCVLMRVFCRRSGLMRTWIPCEGHKAPPQRPCWLCCWRHCWTVSSRAEQLFANLLTCECFVMSLVDFFYFLQSNKYFLLQ